MFRIPAKDTLHLIKFFIQMTMINKLTVVPTAATMAKAIGNSSTFSVNSYTNLNQTETQNNLKTTSAARLIQKHSSVSETESVLEVQDSITSLAIPQSVTILFFLVMAGLGGFLKLKIAHIKFKHDEQ